MRNNQFKLVCAVIITCSIFLVPAAHSDSHTELTGQLIAVYGRGAIHDIQWSADGTMLAVGSSTGLWLYDSDLQDAAPTSIHIGNVNRFVWKSDNTQLAIVGNDQTQIIIWDRLNQTLLTTVDAADTVASLAWSLDGHYLAVGTLAGDLTIWDGIMWTPTATLPFVNHVSNLVWSPSSQLLAVSVGKVYGTPDTNIYLIDSATWSTQPLSFHTEGITTLLWYEGDTKLISGSWDGYAVIWDVSTRQIVRSYNHRDRVNDMAINPSGTLLAGVGFGFRMFVFDLETGTITHQFEVETRMLDSVEWDQNNTIVAFGENYIKAWSLTIEEQIYSLDTAPILLSAKAPISNRYIVVHRGFQLVAYEMGIEVAVQKEHASDFVTIEWFPELSVIGGVGSHGDIHIWDISSTEYIRHHWVDFWEFLHIKWSSNHHFLAMNESHHWLTIINWDEFNSGSNWNDARFIDIVYNEPGFLQDIAWLGDHIAVTTTVPSIGVRIFDTVQGDMTQDIELDDIDSNWVSIDQLHASPDGAALAIVGHGYAGIYSIYLLDVASSAVVHLYTSQQGIMDLAWNPDMSQLAFITPAPDNMFYVLDIEPFSIHAFPVPQSNRLWSIEWGVTGLLAVADLNSVYIWDTTTFDLVLTLEDVSHRISDIQWHPTDSQLAIGGDGVITTWAIASSEASEDCIADASLINLAITDANISNVPTTICITAHSDLVFDTLNNSLNALPIITGDITIEGNGATLTRDETANMFRFFEVAPSGSQ